MVGDMSVDVDVDVSRRRSSTYIIIDLRCVKSQVQAVALDSLGFNIVTCCEVWLFHIIHRGSLRSVPVLRKEDCERRVSAGGSLLLIDSWTVVEKVACKCSEVDVGDLKIAFYTSSIQGFWA